MSGITFEGQLYPYREGETVLEALVRGGAQVSYSCRRGTCQTCVLQLEADSAAIALTQDRLARARLDAGTFLACQTLAAPLSARRLGRNELFVPARIVERAALAQDIMRIRLEPPGSFMWHPGQFVNIRHPNGTLRSYAITSVGPLDYWLELHVHCRPGGRVSSWLRDELQLGEFVELQGPFGDCHYDSSMLAHPLLLISTGVGGGALLGIARDARFRGHVQPIALYHGASNSTGLYLEGMARALPIQLPNLTITQCLADATPGSLQEQECAADTAFAQPRVLANTAILLCGTPHSVQLGKTLALMRGASGSLIRTAAFAKAAIHEP